MVRDGGRVVQSWGQGSIPKMLATLGWRGCLLKSEKTAAYNSHRLFCGLWGWLSHVQEKFSWEDEVSRQEERDWMRDKWAEAHPPNFPSCRCWEALLDSGCILKCDWHEWPLFWERSPAGHDGAGQLLPPAHPSRYLPYQNHRALSGSSARRSLPPPKFININNY